MRRQGFSLFETVLVMAVLVVVSAITVPLIQPMLANNNLQAASDLLRSRWTEMRNRAVTQGRPYRFAIAETTGNFRIAPDEPEFWGEPGEAKRETPAWVVEDTLPGQVLFLNSETAAGSENPPQANRGGNWTRALTFLANGTAREDVQIYFGQAGSRSRVLRLRGTTGSITAD